MKQHLRKHRPRARTSFITIEAMVPTAEFAKEPFSDTVVSIALDQRAFGPRKLCMAFATYDQRFIALTYAPRIDPIDTSLEASLHFFSTKIERDHTKGAAAVVLCDEPVTMGPVPPEFVDKFQHAKGIAARYDVHLVDWIGCDDEQFRFARWSAPATQPGPAWWDVPGASGAS